MREKNGFLRARVGVRVNPREGDGGRSACRGAASGGGLRIGPPHGALVQQVIQFGRCHYSCRKN